MEMPSLAHDPSNLVRATLRKSAQLHRSVERGHQGPLRKYRYHRAPVLAARMDVGVDVLQRRSRGTRSGLDGRGVQRFSGERVFDLRQASGVGACAGDADSRGRDDAVVHVESRRDADDREVRGPLVQLGVRCCAYRSELHGDDDLVGRQIDREEPAEVSPAP